jgi:hypothetical protein
MRPTRPLKENKKNSYEENQTPKRKRKIQMRKTRPQREQENFK